VSKALPGASGALKLQYNPYQHAFFEALSATRPDGGPSYTQLTLFAGRRGGKTRAGSIAIPKLIARKPGQFGWVCAPTYGDLEDFVKPAVFEAIPSGWVKDWSEKHQTLYITGGTRVAFRSLEDPNKARGPGLDFAWIDESRKISQLAWHTMMPALADREGVAIHTTTPNGFDWCWKDLWLPATEQEPGIWACKYKTLDNPMLKPEVVAAWRRRMDPIFAKQEFEADFVTFAGQIYGETALSTDLELSDDQVRSFIPEWPRVHHSRGIIIGVDPGADHPFAVVGLVPTPKGLVQVFEYKKRYRSLGQHWHEVQQILHTLSPERELPVLVRAIDRSQRQTIIEFGQMGEFFQPAENSVVAGIQRVSAWLHHKKLYFVKSRCVETLKDMKSYRWKENENKQGELIQEAVIKINDDLPDALRYALMTWPELPEMDPATDVLDSDREQLPGEWERERIRIARELEAEREFGNPLDMAIAMGGAGWSGEGDGLSEFYA
jgi:hypothetical protein